MSRDSTCVGDLEFCFDRFLNSKDEQNNNTRHEVWLKYMGKREQASRIASCCGADDLTLNLKRGWIFVNVALFSSNCDPDDGVGAYV